MDINFHIRGSRETEGSKRLEGLVWLDFFKWKTTLLMFHEELAFMQAVAKEFIPFV